MTRWLKPILCKHTVVLSLLQGPGTAYRGDGRDAFRRFSFFEHWLGDKVGCLFLAAFPPQLSVGIAFEVPGFLTIFN